MQKETAWDNVRALAVSGSRRNGRGEGSIRFAQMFDRGGPLVAQMVEQDVAELTARPPPQSLEDHFMLAHRFAPALAFAGKIGRVANAADPAGEVGIGREQGRVA